MEGNYDRIDWSYSSLSLSPLFLFTYTVFSFISPRFLFSFLSPPFLSLLSLLSALLSFSLLSPLFLSLLFSLCVSVRELVIWESGESPLENQTS